MPRDEKAIPPDIHAGKGETGGTLASRPDLVKAGAEDFTPEYGREYLDYVSLKKLSPTGVWGKPSEADPEQVEQFVAQWADRSAQYITATFAELEKLKKKE